MKHELIFLGKIKDQFISEGVNQYISRLNHYTVINITTLKAKGRGRSRTQTMDAEGRLLLGAVPAAAKTIVLDSRGRQFTSEKFAEKICRWENQGVKQLCYLIGGPDGHSDRIRECADLILSLSKMTFTHDMARLLLVEQLYRVYTIKAGERYHK